MLRLGSSETLDHNTMDLGEVWGCWCPALAIEGIELASTERRRERRDAKRWDKMGRGWAAGLQGLGG